VRNGVLQRVGDVLLLLLLAFLALVLALVKDDAVTRPSRARCSRCGASCDGSW